MTKGKIGIKIADGSFYPVLEDDFTGRMKLVLTTVRDNQETVQIDLYRGDSERAEGADYVGSLVVENIPPAPKNDPEIEVFLGIDDSGNLEATASDMLTGERQSLSVSLDSLESEDLYSIPDFEIAEEGGLDLEAPAAAEEGGFDLEEPAAAEEDSLDLEVPAAAEEDSLDLEEPAAAEEDGFDLEEPAAAEEDSLDLEEPAAAEDDSLDLEEPAAAEEDSLDLEEPAAAEDDSLLTGETYPIGPEDRRREHLAKRKKIPLMLIGFVLLGLLIIAAVTYLIFRSFGGTAAPPLQGGKEVTEQSAPQEAASGKAAAGETASTEAASEEAASGEAAKPEVAEQPVVVALEKKSTASAAVSYLIKKGDTLWDIAGTYYRNPWLYPKIARANGLPNPDLIFAGETITIPEN